MSKSITKQSFYKYLKCPSWISHEVRGEFRDNPLRMRVQDDALLQEQERRILATRKSIEVTAADDEEAHAKTLELMKQGVPSIYGGALMHGHWIAKPDLFERVAGRSQFGDYYYVACDIKRSRHLKEEYCIQGSFYAEVLRLVQGTKPTQGYVMRPDGAVEAYMLEEYATKFRLTLDGIERISQGVNETHFLTSDCKQSPWFDDCKQETIAADHLSRLNRIWRSEVSSLENAGITTVTQLAAQNPDLVANRVHGISPERLHFLIIGAKTLLSGEPAILSRIDLSDDIEALVVDIEADPLRDLHYLFGVLDIHRGGDEFHAFLATKEEEEKAAWNAFVEFMQSRPGLPVYHYGWYEQDVFRLMAERHGAPEGFVNDLAERSVDLLERLREAIIFPLSFYSLKDIAQYLGFRWRHDDASGLNSVLWYEDWLRTGNREMLDDVVRYNEDDVRATWHVAEWAKKRAV
jgi:uncharacterized protein